MARISPRRPVDVLLQSIGACQQIRRRLLARLVMTASSWRAAALPRLATGNTALSRVAPANLA